MKRNFTKFLVLFLSIISNVFLLTSQTTQSSSQSYFIENKGQWEPSVKYLSKNTPINFMITDNGVIYDMFKDSKNENIVHRTGQVVKMEFMGSLNSNEFISTKKALPYFNYFIGNNQAKWAVKCNSYENIESRIYNGISAVYYFDNSLPRYDLVIMPNTDLSQVKINFKGADDVIVNGEQIKFTTQIGDVYQGKIYAYQEENGVKVQVPCSFVQKENFISFNVDNFDQNKPLIIDPVVFSSYFGGSDDDQIGDVAYFDKGIFAVAGSTASTNFNTTPGAYDTTYMSGYDAFVSKFSIVGSYNQLLFSTYIGSGDVDMGVSVAIDQDEELYITGTTNSSKFPTINGLGKTYNGGIDAFVTKFSKKGDSIVYSSYLGGNKDDYPTRMVINGSKTPFIIGYTNSTNFPIAPGAYQTKLKGMNDVFVAKLTSSGSQLDFCTYFGGTSDDKAYGIDVDQDGNVYLTGETSSGDFPYAPYVYDSWHHTITSQPYDITYNGKADCFVIELSADGGLLYSTYFGGSEDDRGYAIVHNTDGSVYIAGETVKETSVKKYFPVAGSVFGATHNGGKDVFIAQLDKIKTDGMGSKSQTLLFTTFLGGIGDESPRAIKRDPDNGSIFVSGFTSSNNFPILSETSAKHYGKNDCFLTKITPSGSDIIYSTVMGGSGDDIVNGMVIDERSDFILAGTTNSTNFALSNDLIQPIFGGGTNDGFIAKNVIGDLTLNSPYGGLLVCPGSNIDIKWSSNSYFATDTFFVEIYRKSTMNYQTISSKAIGLDYTWKVPDDIKAGNDYYIRVSSLSGMSAQNSQPFSVLANATINSITTIPQNLTICEGDSLKFISSVSGNNLSFQWYLDGVQIPNSNDSIYIIKNISKSGTYKLDVTGYCQHHATSSDFKVNVMPKTKVFVTPYDTIVKKGQQVVFKVSATGSNIKFEWRKDGSKIVGQSDSSFTMNDLSINNRGKYSCLISGDCGIDSSFYVNLTVDTTIASVFDNSTKSDLGLNVKIQQNPTGINILTAVLESSYECYAQVTLIDNLGRTIRTVYDGTVNAGSNEFSLDVSDISQGVYWLLTECGTRKAINKINIIK